MNAHERPTKREAFLAFLAEGWVSLHLDARRPGVDVPPAFSDQAHLVLQYGRDMPIPIPDLEVTDTGVVATLSFARNPHRTQIPWSAVYIVACTDGRGVIYAEDVPEEVSLLGPPAEKAEAKSEGDEAVSPADAETPVRRLRAVAEDESPPEDPESSAAQKRRRRPQLRLVK
jgi:stringent starvation protein B